MPSTTFLPIAGPAATMLSMAVCTALMLVIGSSFAYLMDRRPGIGGVYAYAKEAFGRDHAFLCSWFLTLSYLSIAAQNATALYVVCRNLFGSFWQFGPHYQIVGYDVYCGELLFPVGALLIAGLLFVHGKVLLQRIQTLLAVLLLAGIAITAVLVLPHLDLSRVSELSAGSGLPPAAAVLTIAVLAPWAFAGFDVASLETAHFRFGKGRSRVIVMLVVVVGGLCYIALTLSSIPVQPEGAAGWSGYLEGTGGAAGIPVLDSAQAAGGPVGMAAVGIAAFCAVLTGMIGFARASVRMLSNMALDGVLTSRFKDTGFCVGFVVAACILFSLLGRNVMEWFVELSSFGAVVGFGYASASACKIASGNGDRAAQALGALGTAISVAFALALLVSRVGAIETMSAPSFLLLALWCLVGFAFFWRAMRNSGDGGFSASGTVLFFLLFYSALMWYLKSAFPQATDWSGDSPVVWESVVLMALVSVGLAVMFYVQSLLRKRHAQLEREKMRAEESSHAKSQFLFNMSHDIRTPMNAVLGYAHLAGQVPDTPEQVLGYLGKIDASGHVLLSLIDDILQMGQIESGKMELHEAPADLKVLLSDVRDMFAPQMEAKDIGFSVDCSQVRDSGVVCDAEQLSRVLQNLLGNACKFTHEGGTVKVTLWQVEGTSAGRARYELRVKDSGIGMSKEFAERVFDAFERERSSTVSGIQGTGLGMAITKRIVDLMGGNIEVVTAPGCGTEFVISVEFDLAPEGALEPARADDVADGGPALDGMRVLVAEDNMVNLEIVTMILQSHGVVVDVAGNGREAADKVVAAGGSRGYDAVLMDIQMPVMDGYGATREIRAAERELGGHLPVFAVTANVFDDDIARAREAGMDGHVAKPIDPDLLVRSLSDVRNGIS